LRQNRSQDVLNEYQAKPFRAGSHERFITFNEDIDTVLNIGQAETNVHSHSSAELTDRTLSRKGKDSRASLNATSAVNTQSLKPPLQISLTRTTNTIGSQATPMNPSSAKSCNIR